MSSDFNNFLFGAVVFSNFKILVKWYFCYWEEREDHKNQKPPIHLGSYYTTWISYINIPLYTNERNKFLKEHTDLPVATRSKKLSKAVDDNLLKYIILKQEQSLQVEYKYKFQSDYI